MGIETKLTNFMKLNINSIYTNSLRGKVVEGEYNIFQYALNTPPNQTLQPAEAFNWNGDELVSVRDALSWNPYTRLWYADLNENANQFINNLELTINLGKSFTLTTRAGIDKYYNASTGLQEDAILLTFINITMISTMRIIRIQEEHVNKTKWQVENILSFSKTIRRTQSEYGYRTGVGRLYK